MSKKFALEVGKAVFLTPGGNAKRGWDGQEPYSGSIDTIGRKYFYVKVGYTFIKFDKDTFECKHEDCNSSFTIWETKVDWYSFRDAIRELGEIRDFVSRQSHKLMVGDTESVEIIHDMYRAIK